ncbi:MAG TPA: phosphatase PAP2 family protein [Blastocatellia bacterium]|nr:phosphatase PAP2 family protein [Blastocatellia bacterium]
MSNSIERVNEQTRDEQVGRGAGGGGTDLTVSPERAVRRARWAVLVFVIALAIYAVLAVLAHRYAYFDWDVRVYHAIRSIPVPGFGHLMISLSRLGSGIMPTVLVVGAAVALMAAGFRLEGIICLIGVSLGGAINSLAKLIIARPRPDISLVEVMRHYEHNSFPSGHVVFFVEYFGFLLFLSYVLLKPGPLRNALLVLLSLPIVLIGMSRVYMGAHWPSDTIGAYFAGGIWLALMIEVYRRAKAKRTRQE